MINNLGLTVINGNGMKSVGLLWGGGGGGVLDMSDELPTLMNTCRLNSVLLLFLGNKKGKKSRWKQQQQRI